MRDKWVLNYQNAPNDYKSLKMKSFDNKSDANKYAQRHNLTCYWISHL